MQRISVQSTHIRSIGYDSRKMILEVEFTNGSVYQYLGVPETVYNEIMSASSKGKYLNASVKPYYSYRRV